MSLRHVDAGRYSAHSQKNPTKNPILLQAKAHSGIHPLGQGGHVCSEMELLRQGISKHPIHEAIFGQPLVMLQAFFQGFGEFAMMCRCPYRIWLVHHGLGEQCVQKCLIAISFIVINFISN